MALSAIRTLESIPGSLLHFLNWTYLPSLDIFQATLQRGFQCSTVRFGVHGNSAVRRALSCGLKFAIADLIS